MRGSFKIDKDKFLDVLAVYGSDVDKWPEALKKDMEEVFKSSPGLLEALKEEREFEDLINKQSNTLSNESKDKDPTN